MDEPTNDRTQVFVSLLLEAEPKLYAFVRTQVFHRDDAEDILQETAKVLWEKFDDFVLGTSFTAWGCQIARNKVLQYYKSQHRRKQLLSDEVIALLADKSASLEGQFEDMRQALAQCMELLPPEDREVVHRCYESGVTVRQAADEFGRPYDTIKSVLKRSRHALHACIQRKLAQEDDV